jgi:endonuclease/exonuclease/phosphatase family metal-dependent hydrolase
MNRRQFLRTGTALLSVPLVPPAWTSAADRTTVRVLSYNIHHGEGTDGKLDLERIARVIRAAEPDLVALQEVDRNTKRSGGVDQPKELARLTKLEALFERNIAYQGGDYGNAVLTRLTVKRHKNHLLPSLDRGEQRGVLEVELDAGGEPLLFFATHLDHRPDDRERLASAKAIEAIVTARPQVPALLAGDLNATPESKVLEAFRRVWRVAQTDKPMPTFPAKEPTRQIDYVLYRPAERWKVVEVRVLSEPVASDHRPIFAALSRIPPAG